jgi:hypothetical protein
MAHAQNLIGSEATSMYSFFENLYFKVVKNFGFTSTTKLRTSSTTTYKSDSNIPVLFSISLFHVFIGFLRPRADKIKLAAANSEALYLSKLASSNAIS